MNEEALLARAVEERERIYERYERGRQHLIGQIDPWEDIEIDQYDKIDRYGFIHDAHLPERPRERIQIEVEREKKWVKMLSEWNSSDASEKLKRRIFKGIPDSLRARVWSKLLEVSRARDDHQNTYKEMLHMAKKLSPEIRQIDSDVNRQFRDHQFFRERYSEKQCSLFNVLCAYSVYNSEVGYCQGMSGVAGVLLMYLDEEEAFWALAQLLSAEKYAMHGLYVEGFPKLTRYLQHHDKILSRMLPSLKKHLDKFGLDAILYSLKWFFVCFVERVPFSLCLRVWDVYLLYGERVVTAMAYTILKLHRKHIMKLNDMDLIVHYIQVKLHKDFGYDDDTVIEVLKKSMEELRKAKLEHPGPPPPHELAQRPLGQPVKPTFAANIGHRAENFSSTEKQTTSDVILRREKAALEVQQESRVSQSDSVSEAGACGVNCEGEGSSALGSRRSLANTSITSTADLSVFSSTRSHQADNSLDNSDYSEHDTGCLTARTTPRPTVSPLADDIVRIHVSYAAQQTHDNRIRIHVPADQLTPIVDTNHLHLYTLDT